VSAISLAERAHRIDASQAAIPLLAAESDAAIEPSEAPGPQLRTGKPAADRKPATGTAMHPPHRHHHEIRP
jgi:hypothetical protein